MGAVGKGEGPGGVHRGFDPLGVDTEKGRGRLGVGGQRIREERKRREGGEHEYGAAEGGVTAMEVEQAWSEGVAEAAIRRKV